MRNARSRPSTPVPTNGHPSRKAAVIELYELRVQQKEIAIRLGITRNDVSRSIWEYRQKTGRYIEPVKTAPKQRQAELRDIRETPTAYRWLNYRKSVKGARAALEALGK